MGDAESVKKPIGMRILRGILLALTVIAAVGGGYWFSGTQVESSPGKRWPRLSWSTAILRKRIPDIRM